MFPPGFGGLVQGQNIYNPELLSLYSETLTWKFKALEVFWKVHMVGYLWIVNLWAKFRFFTSRDGAIFGSHPMMPIIHPMMPSWHKPHDAKLEARRVILINGDRHHLKTRWWYNGLYIYTYILIYTCKYIHVKICIYTHVHIYIYTHVYIYICTHTHT